ncbi:MAG: glycosyltransferase family 4 protein [Candidatus Hodarchaeota archaeon]
MKIIFANNFFYLRGGSERVVFDEMSMFEQKGHKVFPFSRHFEDNVFSVYSKYFAPCIKYNEVSFIKKILSTFKLIYSFKTKKIFSNYINQYKPDLVHAHNIYGRLTSSIIDSAKQSRVPVVMTLHDYKFICPSYLMIANGKTCEKCFGNKYYYCLISKCHKEKFVPSFIYTIESYFNYYLKKYNWIKYFISPSKFLQKKFIEAGFSEKKLIYIPNFIDIRKYKPHYDHKNYMLFVGRFSIEKGIITLLKAISDIDMPIKFVGDGPMKKELKTFIRENNILNVTFEGYKTGDELKSIFKNSTFLIFPSEWYENAPMTILEAFSYGKPVIGSKIGGIPEMVKDEVTGLLFRHGDYEDLKDKIKYLLSNPSIIVKMGKKSRNLVETKFNADRHYESLIQLYKISLE